MTDPQPIARHLACYDFPWDITRSLELALFRTFASPRIGALLHTTGEFERCPQKRYDDTDLIVSAIVEHGYDSELGSKAIAHLNAIHGRFGIANEDFLYVLSTFVFEPLRWIERFGWRRPTIEEKHGWFEFWREVGKRMAISDLPETYADFERYNLEYEATTFRYTGASSQVGEATRELFASWFPRVLRPLVRASIHALLDARLRQAFGFPTPAPGYVRAVDGAMQLRARIMRWLPKRRTPRMRTEMRHRTYPDGWRLEDLGPTHPKTTN
jgi:hypothetical protein